MRRLATLVALIGVAFGLSLPGPGSAQVTPAPQILTVDQDRLYGDSQYGRALEAKSQLATQALVAENRKIEADLSAEEGRLTVQRSTLDPNRFNELAAAFDEKVERIRSEQEAKSKQLVADRDAGRKQFFDAAVPILADLMRQLGAFAILNRDAVVLSFDSIDVTDRALVELDARLGDGTKVRPLPEPVPAP